MKVAVVCSSNQNRSMEAQNILSKKGFDVKSYGTGSVVKLPGAGPNQPNVYEFGTTYDEIFKDLSAKDQQLVLAGVAVYEVGYQKEGYTQNGILHMLDRNRRIKKGPERFQDTNEQFDVIFTVEERIYDSVLEAVSARGNVSCTPVQIINIEVKDNHEEATLGAFLILELCEMMRNAEDLEDEIEEILQEFEVKNSRTLLHTVSFY